MAHTQQTRVATTVAAQQAVATQATQAVAAQQQATVVQPVTLRARRVAAVQVALMQRRVAAKQAKFAQVQHAAKVAAYQAAVAALAQQHGLPVPTVALAPRANSATVQPSSAVITVNGVQYKPTKAVHAIAAANPNATRKQVLQLCINAGINQATAATQYNVFKQQGKQA